MICYDDITEEIVASHHTRVFHENFQITSYKQNVLTNFKVLRIFIGFNM